ncbi:MAG: endonuclease III [Deltaproteobacteria bacterium]|nr:endonuclease III [Deltaproteobacteria bacterium]MBI2348617.1 endonuclease III [Deltaproteobacteria bacterium]MBI2540798.1 endonuclease III [Deltaproteobacteria bacterium]
MTRPRQKKRKLPADRARVEKIISRLNRAHPDAKLDLDFTNPLELLIALILAAQARDDLVNQITPALFVKYRTAEDYAAAPPEELEKEVRRINFYRNKSRLIKNCCAELARSFNGEVPSGLEELLTLPGVGRKTGNIVLGNAFDRQAIGVDTHVMRLSQRLGLTRNTNPDKIEFDLTAIVPEKQRVRFCHLLQYHGRRVCFAKKPRCPECVIKSLCPYPEKSTA